MNGTGAVDTNVTVWCDPIYSLSRGPDTIRCTSEGTWSPMPPTCVISENLPKPLYPSTRTISLLPLPTPLLPYLFLSSPSYPSPPHACTSPPPPIPLLPMPAPLLPSYPSPPHACTSPPPQVHVILLCSHTILVSSICSSPRCLFEH